jgi:hypothetical protein
VVRWWARKIPQGVQGGQQDGRDVNAGDGERDVRLRITMLRCNSCFALVRPTFGHGRPKATS